MLAILFFFHEFFFEGKLISAADFLFLWDPWSDYRPENFVGAQNHIVSDWVDSLIPNFKSIEAGDLIKFVTGYRDGSNWGHPDTTFIGSITHDPLIIVLIKIFNSHLGSTLLFLTKSIIAGTGMFFFLKSLEVRDFNSVLGGILLAFSVPLISAIYGTAIMGLVLLPWIFLVLKKLADSFSTKNLLIYIFLIIWLITSNFPITIAYVVIIGVLFFLLLLGKDNKRSIQDKLRIVVLFLMINLIILGLWSWSLLPNIANFKEVDLGYRGNYGIRRLHIDHFFQFFYPNYCGNGTSIPWICDSNWIETSTYSGVVSLVMFFLGLPIIFLSKIKKSYLPIFFYSITFLLLCLIFNWFYLSNLTSHIPLLNLNPNTRLVFIVPFFTVTSGIVAFSYLQKYLHLNEDIRVKTFFIWFLLFSSIIGLFVLRLETFRDHLYKLPVNILKKDFLHASGLGILSLLGSIILIFGKSKKVQLIVIFLLIPISVWDLYYYNNAFLPYQEPSEIFPLTEGIQYLQENMKQQDRILAVERVFLPNTNEYYGINALTGHDWRTTEFNDIMQPIQPGIFDNSATLEFINREKVVLNEDILNYLRFNRIKFIVQASKALPPQYDILFNQPNIEGYYHIDKKLEYQILVSSHEKIQELVFNASCKDTAPKASELNNFSILIEKVDGSIKEINIMKSTMICDENKLILEVEEKDINPGDSVIVKINKLDELDLALWKSRDLRKDTQLISELEAHELVMKIYYKQKETFPIQYRGDMLISSVRQDDSVAYYYSCKDVSESDCKSNLTNFKLENPYALEEFNVLYNKLIELPITHYDEGNIIIDTSGVQPPGILVLSDNYFEGWKSNQGVVFQGFLGGLNVFIDEPVSQVSLRYINPYFVIGVGITLLSGGLLLFVLRKIRELNP